MYTMPQRDTVAGEATDKSCVRMLLLLHSVLIYAHIFYVYVNI